MFPRQARPVGARTLPALQSCLVTTFVTCRSPKQFLWFRSPIGQMAALRRTWHFTNSEISHLSKLGSCRSPPRSTGRGRMKSSRHRRPKWRTLVTPRFVHSGAWRHICFASPAILVVAIAAPSTSSPTEMASSLFRARCSRRNRRSSSNYGSSVDKNGSAAKTGNPSHRSIGLRISRTN